MYQTVKITLGCTYSKMHCSVYFIGKIVVWHYMHNGYFKGSGNAVQDFKNSTIDAIGFVAFPRNIYIWSHTINEYHESIPPVFKA